MPVHWNQRHGGSIFFAVYVLGPSTTHPPDSNNVKRVENLMSLNTHRTLNVSTMAQPCTHERLKTMARHLKSLLERQRSAHGADRAFLVNAFLSQQVLLADSERDWLTHVCLLNTPLPTLCKMPWWNPDFPTYDDMMDDLTSPLHKTSTLLICPDYKRLGTKDDARFRHVGHDEQEARFRDFHDYMTVVGYLPRPFDDDPAPELRKTLVSALDDAVTLCDRQFCVETLTHGTPDKVVKALRAASHQADVIFIVMCGHGVAAPQLHPGTNASGTLMLAGGKRFTAHNLAAAMADFKGTLIVAYVMCNAEGEEPYPATVAAIAPEPHDGQQLHPECKIVRLFCSRHSDTITPTQARVIVKLLDAMIHEMPEYVHLQDFIDERWAAMMRDLISSSPSHHHLVRAPPIVQVPVATTGGRFLRPLLTGSPPQTDHLDETFTLRPS